MIDVNNFEAMKIGLASPEQIREWSYGEVKKPETINYRTLKPERDGLFCEKIFGPIKDWECHCGKYKRIRFKGIKCDKCGVEVTRSKVRRERMGHIELATPVSHIWYFKGVPSRIGLLLDMSPRSLERIIYFAAYVVVDPGQTGLEYKQLLSEMEYREFKEKFKGGFRAGIGAEAVKELLENIELEKLYAELRVGVRTLSGQKRSKAIKRLEVVEAFRKSGNQPEWMVLDVIPVIPPELRPMVQLDGGRFATSDLNDLYRRVINRNNRLKRLLDLGAPEIIVKNEKRMLQEAVDAIIDNGRRGRPVTGPNNRPLKSLSDMLKGKQGRFRQNLLGKRVDYSGRSVIVVGPHLKLHQCGLPKEMALELFKPFVMKSLVDRGMVHNIKSAKKKVERVSPEVWDVLEEVILDHPVLLNRAPTLHRLGIQAFEPVLVEGKAIQIHPLVCTPYNADFDGDQMAVHLPLSAAAQAEARILMLSSNNLLLPAYGDPATVPTQDMVLGCYYMTVEKPEARGTGKIFSGEREALLAYEDGLVELQALVNVKIKDPQDKVEKMFKTTVGRLIFNQAFPDDIDDPYRNIVIDKHELKRLVSRFHRRYGNARTATLLDKIKEMGFRFATQSGTTISVDDIQIPKEKGEILDEADAKVDITDDFHSQGLLTDEEKYRRVIEIWNKATEDVANAMMRGLDKLNPVCMMANSGARGNVAQMKQIAGMRGLMADPSGRILPLPIKANLREGLTVLEYFISTHGARKGLADTALRTADSGYLTRRLIDVAQDIIVREVDCQTNEGIMAEPITEGAEIIVPLPDRIVGRISIEDITYTPEEVVEPLVKNLMGRTAAEDVFKHQSVDLSGKLVSLVGEILHQEVRDPATGDILGEPGKKIDQEMETAIREAGISSLELRKQAIILKGKKISRELAREIRPLLEGALKVAGEKTVIVPAGQEIQEEDVELIEKFVDHPIHVRSVLKCKARHGVCAACYGRNLATGQMVEIGETVGIIAAQSIGEPGTQLTLRTFHYGGVASEDIIQGLPRVEELFEARKPKNYAFLSEIEGIVQLGEEKGMRKITIESTAGDQKSYLVPFSQRLMVLEGSHIEAGIQLTDGPLNPHDILRIRGQEAAEQYLLDEVQKVYRSQGVDINDKHVEVISRQMLRKVKVEEAGDTELLPGGLVDSFFFEDENLRMLERGGGPATARPVLLGVTKASLATDSFLSAASFQETTRVLTEAAIKGKVDPLLGLKENVIIGKLIPAGTGMTRYRNIDIATQDGNVLRYERPLLPLDGQDLAVGGEEALEIRTDSAAEVEAVRAALMSGRRAPTAEMEEGEALGVPEMVPEADAVWDEEESAPIASQLPDLEAPEDVGEALEPPVVQWEVVEVVESAPELVEELGEEEFVAEFEAAPVEVEAELVTVAAVAAKAKAPKKAAARQAEKPAAKEVKAAKEPKEVKPAKAAAKVAKTAPAPKPTKAAKVTEAKATKAAKATPAAKPAKAAKVTKEAKAAPATKPAKASKPAPAAKATKAASSRAGGNGETPKKKGSAKK